MKPLLIPLAAGLTLWLLQAFAPPLSQVLARRWVRLYTWGLSPDLRALRMDDAASFFGELQRDMLRDGCKAEHVALRLLANVARGAWHDLAWRRDLAARAQSQRSRRTIVEALQLGLFTLQAGMLPAFVWYEFGAPARYLVPVVAVSAIIGPTISWLGWHSWQHQKRYDAILDRALKNEEDA